MRSSWVAGLEPDAKKEIKGEYLNAHRARKRLTELCADKVELADKAGYSKDGYDCPNWAYRQADLQGYKRALHEVMNLIE